MNTLTVIIPTYNEASCIEDAIKSVSFANEIIIIDSLSSDNTKKLALNIGCIVLERKFDNFSDQKNYAIATAKSDWILFIDADERVTEKLKIDILNAIQETKYGAYKIKFPHFYMNRFLYHSENKVIRLAKNTNLQFKGAVHEKLIHSGKVGILKNFMIHYTYKGLFNYIQKKDSYAWFQAQMSLDKGKKATIFHLAFKPFYRFFHSYVIRRGFMDGIPGIAVASIDAYGVFSRYVKMYLLQKNQK
jgi:glycosyltransferase involved in cell wall biosynthesis